MKKSGFTLVELSVTVLIISIISLVLIIVFRSNLNTVKFGQKHMDFNQKVFLAMRRIFYDIKQINPVLSPSNTYGYVIKGEQKGEPKPKIIYIRNFKNRAGSELEFVLAKENDVEEIFTVKYYLKLDKLKNYNLIRYTRNLKAEEKEEVILENVPFFEVQNDEYDVKQIFVKYKAKDTKNNLSRDVDFAVRLESDFVYVDKQDNL